MTPEDTNSKPIYCDYCNSLILHENLGKFVKQQHDLPLVHQKNSKGSQDIEYESLDEFWLVVSIFNFENIGFSNTVEGWKFLVCAECEMGPVGYHDLDTKYSYIARQRVRAGSAKGSSANPS